MTDPVTLVSYLSIIENREKQKRKARKVKSKINESKHGKTTETAQPNLTWRQILVSLIVIAAMGFLLFTYVL